MRIFRQQKRQHGLQDADAKQIDERRQKQHRKRIAIFYPHTAKVYPAPGDRQRLRKSYQRKRNYFPAAITRLTRGDPDEYTKTTRYSCSKAMPGILPQTSAILSLIAMILLVSIHPWDHKERKSGLLTAAFSLALLGFIAYMSA
jgi:hypothetical protein